jgi:DNA-binding winged helix-turn-helix (wHTH) protein
MRVSFGEFAFDSERRELTSDGLPVHLSPKAFQLLAFLIEHRPRAMAKEDLYAHLWPATFVEEANLKNLVAEIRAALGDDPRAPRFVKTLYGHGYAFIAATARLDATSALPEKANWFLQHYSRMLGLGEGENVVGRDPARAAVVDEPDVSRYHARIVIAGDSVTIEDLGSKNGTFVDGARIREKTNLAPGSEIGLGATVLWFRRRGALQSTKSASFARRT